MQASRERPRALALGIWLASRGGLVGTALGLVALGGIAAAAAAFLVSERALPHLASTAAVASAWSGGVMLAFAGALRAITRDWEDGVLALARARGVRPFAYIRGRVMGLVVVLALAIGGATLVTSLAATSVSTARAETARDAVGALAYALAFAATMGPVAMAALGSGSRVGGYLALLGVLALPELLAPWTATLLPHGWHELTSIPAALEGLKAGILAPGASGLGALRAVIGLAAVVALSLVAIRARIPRVAPFRESATK